jgi:hypothetical protein
LTKIIRHFDIFLFYEVVIFRSMPIFELTSNYTSGVSANRRRNFIKVSTRLPGLTRVIFPTACVILKLFLENISNFNQLIVSINQDPDLCSSVNPLIPHNSGMR